MATASVTVIIPEYRDSRRAADLVRTLRSQQIGLSKSSVEVVVVDDGSDDGSAEWLEQAVGRHATIVALPENKGRAEARNAGARMAGGDILVFMDADCTPETTDFIAAHVASYAGDTVAVAGAVSGADGSFWDRYQQEASRKRRRLHFAGHTHAGSTQNFSVLRTAFVEVGGFDARYRQYGFEDRDLLVRLAARGRIEWSDGARVRHLDPLSLPGVLAKMQCAGGESALLFAESHPEAYRALGYAAIDARLHQWLLVPARVLGPLMRLLTPLMEPLLRFRPLFSMTRRLVKLAGAVAFMYGTTRTSQSRLEQTNTC